MSDEENELIKLAVKDLLGRLSEEGMFKEGILSHMGVALFVRLHELGGKPITSKIMYRKEKKGAIAIRELGPLQDVIKLAQDYGLDSESLEKELSENPCCYLHQEFLYKKGVVVIRAGNRFNTGYHADKVLNLYADAFGLKNLKKLLEYSRTLIFNLYDTRNEHTE